MAFDGSGNYVRNYNWTQDAANAIPITASRFDTEHNGFAAALSICVTRDGQGKPTSDISWQSHGITSLRDPTAPQEPVTLAFLNGTSGLNYLQGTQIKYIQTTAEAAASVTPTNYFIPSHDVVGHVLPQRYGFAVAASGATNYSALVNANAVATQAKSAILIPGGAYTVTPSAAINFGCDVIGSGMAAVGTTITISSSYGGVCWRFTGNNEARSLILTMQSFAKTAGSIGIQLAAAVVNQNTGNIALRQCYIAGFEKNIDLQNVTVVTLDHVTSTNGTEGHYCVPDSSGGFGYVTTFKAINCQFFGNTRNVYFKSPVNSIDISFDGGTIENATGGVEQAHFENILTLKMENIYTEGAVGIPWAFFVSIANISIDGFVNIAGGATSIGDNNQVVSIRNVYTTGATSVLTAAGTTNSLTLESCKWPASGNTFGGAKLSIDNSSINGVSYDCYKKEINSLVGNRIDRQAVAIAGAGATDIYRFLDQNGAVLNSTYEGELSVIAKDNATGANQASYHYVLQTTANGATGTTLTQTTKTLRGTDPGVAANPLTLVADGGGGAAKIQFQKNAAIAQVNVTTRFDGLVV